MLYSWNIQKNIGTVEACRCLRPVMSRVVVLSCKAIIISPQRRALAAELVGCFLKQMPQESLKAAALFLSLTDDLFSPLLNKTRNDCFRFPPT